MEHTDEVYIDNLSTLLDNPKAPKHLLLCQARHVFNLPSIKNGEHDFLLTRLAPLSTALWEGANELGIFLIKSFIYDMVCFAVKEKAGKKWTARTIEDTHTALQWREWFKGDDPPLGEKLASGARAHRTLAA